MVVCVGHLFLIHGYGVTITGKINGTGFQQIHKLGFSSNTYKIDLTDRNMQIWSAQVNTQVSGAIFGIYRHSNIRVLF